AQVRTGVSQHPARHADVAGRREAPSEGLRSRRLRLRREAVPRRGAARAHSHPYARSARRMRPGGGSEGGPVTVVVVDDSPFVCRLRAKQPDSTRDLSVTGTAHDGASGLELIRAVRPDVVTLDLDMPGMSGLEALDRLMEESPTPVVVLSGVSRRAAAVTKE